MDIKILFIFVGNKCALDYKKEQQFAWSLKHVCLFILINSPLYFYFTLFSLLLSYVLVDKYIFTNALFRIYVLNAFHSFQLSKPLNISWKMIFWELFKNKIVQIPLYSFRKIQTLSAAVHAFFYLFLFIFGMEWKGFQCSLRFR